MGVLGLLEHRPAGVSIRDLCQALGQPRSTIYRILNTLERHAVVRRTLAGNYVLGPRLLEFAAHVRIEGVHEDLARLAQPHLHRLSEETGEASKISVRYGDRVLAIAAAQSTHGYGLTPTVGQDFPLHAGAASKVLLAHVTAEELDTLLAAELSKFTPSTITDPDDLRRELKSIRTQGWAEDRGEHGSSVHAFAAPVLDADGRVIAAVSIPFLADKEQQGREILRSAVIKVGAEISDLL